MEQEVGGRYITKLVTNTDGTRRVYAIFAKDIMGTITYVMYEVDSPEDREFQFDIAGLSWRAARANSLTRPVSRTTPPAYIVPGVRSLPRSNVINLDEEIIGFRTSFIPEPDMINVMAQRNWGEDLPTIPELSWVSDVQTDDTVLFMPPENPITEGPYRMVRRNPVLVEPLLAENITVPEPPFQPEPDVVGYLRTTWTASTNTTPPPYVRMDARRRPNRVAHIEPDNLPLSELPDSPSITPPLAELPEEMEISVDEEARAAHLPPEMEPWISEPLKIEPAVAAVTPPLPSRSPRTYSYRPSGARPRAQPQPHRVTREDLLGRASSFPVRTSSLSRLTRAEFAVEHGDVQRERNGAIVFKREREVSPVKTPSLKRERSP